MIKTFINQFTLLTAVSLSACSPSASLDAGDLETLELLHSQDNSSLLNGISVNGISVNGISVNGISVNGISVNGISVNGISVNGPSLVGLSYGSLSLSGQELREVRLDGPVLTGFRTSDRKRLRGAELTGAVLNGGVLLGTVQVSAPFRIDRVDSSSDSDVIHYSVSMFDGTQWSPMCGRLSNGAPIRTVALPGRWNAESGNYVDDDDSFTFACENAALGKCVLWGYRPWATASECDSNDRCRTQPLSAWHQACTRMVRADYCGDGRAHTRNGTTINIWDPLSIQTRDSLKGVSLEAEWTQEGAVCIQHTRWVRADASAAETDLQYVQRVCPERLAANAKNKACSDSRSDFLSKNGLREDLDTRPLFRNESALNQ